MNQVAYHEHDGYSSHPVAVQHHNEYFAGKQEGAKPTNIKDSITHPKFREITETLAKYGEPYLVGGSVRDAFLGKPVKDFDIEVYGIPEERLGEIVQELGGKNDQVGKQFGVYKIGTEFDISLPRKETKTGDKHTDFDVKPDPWMSPKDAAKRRDFTINALMMSPDGEIHDFFGGINDLQNKILRHIDDKTFVEDALRVYRAAQFAARFGFKIAPETIELASRIDLSHLPPERIYEEFKKLLLRAKKPSVGFQALDEMKVFSRYYPEIAELKKTPQRGDYHAEGSVFNHVGMVLDKAAEVVEKLPDEKDKLSIMLAAIAHDLGKPAATKEENGKITQHGHEEMGLESAKKFLSKLTNETDVVENVLFLVENHGLPTSFWRNKVPDSAFKRAINKYGLKRLNMLADFSEADTTGRLWTNQEGKTELASREESDWFRSRLEEVTKKYGATTAGTIPPLVTGDEMLEIGFPSSPMMGKALKEIKTKQEDGELTSKEEAIKYIKEHYDEYLVGKDLRKAYSRAKCMHCDKPPTTEFLWAEGRAHAWFCDKHADQFRKEQVWHGVSQIDKERAIEHGVASESIKEDPPTKDEADEYLEKASKPGYHEHDGFAEHPVVVKYHQRYFSHQEKQKTPKGKLELLFSEISRPSLRHRFLSNDQHEKVKALKKDGMETLESYRLRIAYAQDAWDKEITKASNWLPFGHMSLVSGIRVSRREDIKKGGMDISGTYNPLSALIVLDANADAETIVHEFGHAVWYRGISSEDKQLLSNLYEDCKLANAGFVSNYAETSIHEFFAESYAVFLISPNELKERNQKLFGILSDIVRADKIEKADEQESTDVEMIDPVGVGHFDPDLPDLKDERMEKANPPRPGLVPKSGDYEHPDRWIKPDIEKPNPKQLVSKYQNMMSGAKDFHEVSGLMHELFKKLGSEYGMSLEQILELVDPEGHKQRADAEMNRIQQEENDKKSALSYFERPTLKERMDYGEKALLELADSWGEKNFGKWQKGLAGLEKRVLLSYMNTQYSKINRALRSGKPNFLADDLEHAFKNVATPSSVVVYRGCSEFIDFKPNMKFSDAGFVSTSLLPQIAIRAMEMIQNPVMMEIKIPKGARGAYVGNLNPDAEEAELLIGNGSTFEVSEIREEKIKHPDDYDDNPKKVKIITLELVDGK